MAYVIAEPCIGTKDTACVDACPVDCIHPKKETKYEDGRSSFDEVPQLWNILRGDMSFVGPRPAIPDEVEKYEPWQRRRLRMRPGLTCIWVLEGRSHIDFHRWIQLDLAYIDNWSLWLDCKIFLRTIPIRQGCILRTDGFSPHRHVELGAIS